jgi:transposase-like protein
MSKEERTRQMYSLVEQWQQSGESQKAFAQEHQINPHTLRYWINKKLKTQDAPSGFVELTGSTSTPISLRYPNGVELLLPPTVSVTLLKGLIQL